MSVAHLSVAHPFLSRVAFPLFISLPPSPSSHQPIQMRHTFASLLLERGAPITYVSRQLGHGDASITLRVYAHCLPDAWRERLVDRLDATHHPQPPRNRCSRAGKMRCR